MITDTTDRHLYIGGSEANMIYMGYHTKTFQSWWSGKLRGVVDDSPPNHHMNVGTILESDIITLYEAINGVKGVRDYSEVKGIARANTDVTFEDKVSDVKCTTKAFEWYLKDQVPIQYRRQLLHYCYVLGLRKASIIAYQVDDDLLNDPFQELVEHKLFEIDVPITEDDLHTHQAKIEYLEECKERNVFPE